MAFALITSEIEGRNRASFGITSVPGPTLHTRRSRPRCANSNTDPTPMSILSHPEAGSRGYQVRYDAEQTIFASPGMGDRYRLERLSPYGRTVADFLPLMFAGWKRHQNAHTISLVAVQILPGGFHSSAVVRQGTSEPIVLLRAREELCPTGIPCKLVENAVLRLDLVDWRFVTGGIISEAFFYSARIGWPLSVVLQRRKCLATVVTHSPTGAHRWDLHPYAWATLITGDFYDGLTDWTM